ncbi:hypothetical protein [Actinocrispum wychmicini]|uniref:Lipoprotein LprG n=1 Tax=Actinocrispum wychmicini TaxID=1213861 RepID=A0A4R2K6Z0_9PSEU|nr:hypothetical protein [Actinocrispum wychmicini]TCO65709.1 hypothetical protein EV192_1011501 [Actinocrispum wychmicini]
MRKTLVAAAGLALVLTVAGCGTKENGTPVAADNNSASTGGGSGGGLKIFGNTLDLAGAVKNNNKATSAKMSIDMSGSAGSAGAISMKGSGAFKVDGSNVAMQMSLDMSSLGTMEMRIVDKALYMKLPANLAGQAGMSADKPWVKISADGTDPLSKTLGPMIENMSSNFDVSKQMEQIKAAGQITKSAKETLDGQETTHYWITVDMAKAAQSLPDPEMRKLAEQAAGTAGMKTINEEFWVNADNLPVQVVVATPIAQGQSANVTVKYTDWGQPVDVQAPPASQVGEMPR